MVQRLTSHETQAAMAAGATLVDFRLPPDFVAGHIPGSVNAPFNRLAPARALALVVAPGSTILITSDQDVLTNIAADLLARSGVFVVQGVLDGGLSGWKAAGLPVQPMPTLDAIELHDRLAAGPPADLAVVDVREPHEWQAGVIPGALLVPLSQFLARVAELDPSREYGFVCSSGVRSVQAASVAAQHGLRAANITGGMNQWTMMRYEMVRPGPS